MLIETLMAWWDGEVVGWSISFLRVSYPEQQSLGKKHIVI